MVLFALSCTLQVLSVLVRAVTENIADASGDASSQLRPKLLELFGHITAKVTNSVDIWRLYAELLATSDSLTDTLHERVRRNLSCFICNKTCIFVSYCRTCIWMSYIMHCLGFYLTGQFFCSYYWLGCVTVFCVMLL